MRISDWSSDVCSSDLVDVKPERRTFPINRGEDFANGLFDTGLPDAPNRKASYPRCLDVALGVVRIKFIALANLRDVPVLDQRRAVPDCQEGFAPSGGEREIPAGCRTQPGFCILVPKIEEDRKSTRLNSSH